MSNTMADTLFLVLLSVNAILLISSAGVYSTKLKLENECSYTVWPRAVPGNGSQPLTAATTLTLEPGESAFIFIPSSWYGQLWARTRCSYDFTGRFTCLTGDCDTGSAECDSAQTVPPVTVAEFNISGNAGLDFYGVSATRGYNLAMLVVPQSDGEANCMATACVNGPNGGCPHETSGSCTTTCFAFGDPKNCCSGAYVRRGVCNPSEYSSYFGSRCPWAPSYVYDENDGKKKNRAFACSMADYLITFCPHPSLATGRKVAAGAKTRSSSAGKTKTVILIALVVVTMVIAILLIASKVFLPGLVVDTASAICTALGLLFAL